MLQASYAKPQAAALFLQLKQLWDSDEHPVLHGQALLLQACLAGMLAPAESPLQLAQQALKLLQDQVSITQESAWQSFARQVAPPATGFT